MLINFKQYYLSYKKVPERAAIYTSFFLQIVSGYTICTLGDHLGSLARSGVAGAEGLAVF